MEDWGPFEEEERAFIRASSWVNPNPTNVVEWEDEDGCIRESLLYPLEGEENDIIAISRVHPASTNINIKKESSPSSPSSPSPASCSKDSGDIMDTDSDNDSELSSVPSDLSLTPPPMMDFGSGPNQLQYKIRPAVQTDSEVYRRGQHLINLGAITPQNFPGTFQKGLGSFEQQTEGLIHDWNLTQGDVKVFRSRVKSEIMDRDKGWKGVYPSICEHPEEIEQFQVISVADDGVMKILDPDGVLQAYRFKVPTPVTDALQAASEQLPAKGKRSSGKYGNKPAFSKELPTDGAAGWDWIESTELATEFINHLLQMEVPEEFVKGNSKELRQELKAYHKHMMETDNTYKKKIGKLFTGSEERDFVPPFGAFHGVCINRGVEADDSQTHLDWLDDPNNPNIVIPFGSKFEDGRLVLWQLKVVIEVPLGWGILFPGALIAHRLTPVKGVRNSVDYFLHKSLYDWLAKRINTNPHLGKERKEKAKDPNRKKSLRAKKNQKTRAEHRKGQKGVLKEKRGRQARVMKAGKKCNN
ncbi:hypothetical protein BJ508DRAFT_336739 [Ascobolus immersus RN42]|uniref:Uncharacterized protein n=1 Tax=Ascobolus immersus RN42 TaxID=1160509 RepID=A0A3N4H7K7_ASCIM|nr:hypothetical protein BJ508DRAFT_336739 [Ascobolus immersus RN42]